MPAFKEAPGFSRGEHVTRPDHLNPTGRKHKGRKSVACRLSDEALDALDRWRACQGGVLDRSAAIIALVSRAREGV